MYILPVNSNFFNKAKRARRIQWGIGFLPAPSTRLNTNDNEHTYMMT